MLPEVVDLPRCNNADADWYVNIPTDPTPVDPKVETLPKLCEEVDVTLKPASFMIDNWLLH